MSESLATSDEPETPPRKGPGSEAPEEVASTAQRTLNRAFSCEAQLGRPAESGLVARCA